MTTLGALGRALVAAFFAIPHWWAVPVGLAVVMAVIVLVRPRSLSRLERVLNHRGTPAVLGLVAAAAMWFAWGSLRQEPILQDEAAYLLQARLFAAGHWTDSLPPVPEFFEEPHVLVVPALASKYHPGHSLLMAPGIRLRAPGLVPVVLLGLTAALIFVLARDVAPTYMGPWPALAAYVLWLSLLGGDAWPRPSYMSEISTSALWLAGWWALLRWRDRGTFRYAILLGVCIAWGTITRPLTMLAYAIPTGIITLILVARTRRWRQLAVACACGAAVLGILPLWSLRTTGDWRTSPRALYTAQYMPWDVVGFGYQATPPLRPLPAEIACLQVSFGEAHRLHRPEVLPGQLAARGWGLLEDTFAGWRRGLILLAAVGLLWAPIELWLAVGSCAALLVCYLAYPHHPTYTIYYMEAQSTLVVLAAFGVCGGAALIGGRLNRNDFGGWQENRRWAVSWCVLGSLVLAVPMTIATLQLTRGDHNVADMPRREFLRLVRALPERQTVVFVRYPPGEGCGNLLIENSPPVARARQWIVYDRGPENERLLRVAPGRVPYVFDTRSFQLQRYDPPPGTVTASPAG